MIYRTDVFFVQKKFVRSLTAGQIAMQLTMRLNTLDLQDYSPISIALSRSMGATFAICWSFAATSFAKKRRKKRAKQ